jgi:hypothetical protein
VRAQLRHGAAGCQQRAVVQRGCRERDGEAIQRCAAAGSRAPRRRPGAIAGQRGGSAHRPVRLTRADGGGDRGRSTSQVLTRSAQRCLQASAVDELHVGAQHKLLRDIAENKNCHEYLHVCKTRRAASEGMMSLRCAWRKSDVCARVCLCARDVP